MEPWYLPVIMTLQNSSSWHVISLKIVISVKKYFIFAIIENILYLGVSVDHYGVCPGPKLIKIIKGRPDVDPTASKVSKEQNILEPHQNPRPRIAV